VHPIPAPKGAVYKAVPMLANESVLLVEMFYEVKNRKPWQLIHSYFLDIMTLKKRFFVWHILEQDVWKEFNN